ncbi:RNA polymerase subunit sigma-70 [Macrococcus capreoli]
MNYTPKDIKKFIKYYTTLDIPYQEEVTSDDLDINTFFDISKDSEHYSLTVHTDEVTFMNRLLTIAETLGTDRECCIFYLISEGKTIKEISKIFLLSEVWIRKIYNNLIQKICDSLNTKI